MDLINRQWQLAPENKTHFKQERLQGNAKSHTHTHIDTNKFSLKCTQRH